MFQFSIKTLLVLVVMIAIICMVFFAVPLGVRYVTLFVGVLSLPGPLFILYRNGRDTCKSCALGGLISYGMWGVVAGIPAGVMAASHFTSFVFVGVDSIPHLVPNYFVFSVLYAPWLVTFVGSFGSIIVHRACRSGVAHSPASCKVSSISVLET